MRFIRYPKGETYQVTPRKLAAARRAVQAQKDRYPLFPEFVTHKSAEERLDAIAGLGHLTGLCSLQTIQMWNSRPISQVGVENADHNSTNLRAVALRS